MLDYPVYLHYPKTLALTQTTVRSSVQVGGGDAIVEQQVHTETNGKTITVTRDEPGTIEVNTVNGNTTVEVNGVSVTPTVFPAVEKRPGELPASPSARSTPGSVIDHSDQSVFSTTLTSWVLRISQQIRLFFYHLLDKLN